MKFGRKREIVKRQNALMKHKENVKAFPIIEREAFNILAGEFAKGKENDLRKAFESYNREARRNIVTESFGNGQRNERVRKRIKEEVERLERALERMGEVLGSKERAKEFLREYTKVKWKLVKYRDKLLKRKQ